MRWQRQVRWQRQGRVLSFGAALLGGCSWSRFDDVSDNAPVVELKIPGDFERGFGLALATITDSEPDAFRVRLMSTAPAGTTGAATYELGGGESPTTDALDAGHCVNRGDSMCQLLRQPAALMRAATPGDTPQERREFCFVSGIGRAGTVEGLVGRCATDNVSYALRIPDMLDADIVMPALAGDRAPDVFLAADRSLEPALLAGSPEVEAAWYYAPLSLTPRELMPPEVPEGFGGSVAVLRLEAASERRLYVVGAPEAGEVWLFRSDANAEAAQPIGCLASGGERFGRSLAAGRVDSDAADDLVVADERVVSVFSGAALASLPVTNSSACSLASLPEGGLVASFTCGSRDATSGCEVSDFGRSLAVGDLDGDGDGEVVVGAPGMRVRDEDRAGALLIYDAEGADPVLSDIRFLSSADQDDALGRSLATPRLSDRHIIAAGAPGGERTVLFYCSDLVPEAERSDRCK